MDDGGASEAVRLRVGESCELALPGLGTAGYRWTCTPADTVVVSFTWRLSAPPAVEHEPRRVGRSADEVLRVTGEVPGRTVLLLQQRRGWTEDPPRSTRTIEVRVDE